VLTVLTQGVTTNNLWILPTQSFRMIPKQLTNNYQFVEQL